MKKLAIVSAIVSVALTACAQFQTNDLLSPQDLAAQLCTRLESHCVKVTVASGAISVDPVDVHIGTSRERVHWVVWYIDTPSYIFVNETGNRPIVFKTATTQFNPEDPINGCYHWFSNIVPPNGRVFLCVDRNTVSGRFPYTIKVTPTGSAPAVPPLDPAVFND